MKKPPPTEKALIRAAQRGDHRAFQSLVAQHTDQVRRTVIGMLGEGPVAEDVAQEVFIRLFRSLDQFAGTAQLSTYLHRVAINLSLDTLKKQERRRRWQLPFGKNTVQETSDLADPISWVEQQELQDGIARALQQLSPDFRAVVLLRLVQGYPVAETASMLGIPEGTVASRLARAQQQLRHILRTEGWS